MAQRWLPKPGGPVGLKEPVGRRLFDEPALVGATDQKPKQSLDYRHFEETRIPIEVSFDRLGPEGIDRKVVTYLAPIARAHAAARRAKKFGGWVWLKAAQLNSPPKGTAFPVIASPIQPSDPEHAEHNPYHAHTACTGDAHSVALHLQWLFTSQGKMRECKDPRDRVTIGQRISKVGRFLGGLIRWKAAPKK
jgi:hypothetical protein